MAAIHPLAGHPATPGYADRRGQTRTRLLRKPAGRRRPESTHSLRDKRPPGNGAAIGGLKVVTANGWFAPRPSGTENVYRIYAESFKDQAHLDAIVHQAQQIVSQALAGGAQ